MVEFKDKWKVTLQELLHQGLIRPHPLVMKSGGIEGILQGMDDVEEGKV